MDTIGKIWLYLSDHLMQAHNSRVNHSSFNLFIYQMVHSPHRIKNSFKRFMKNSNSNHYVIRTTNERSKFEWEIWIIVKNLYGANNQTIDKTCKHDERFLFEWCPPLANTIVSFLFYLLVFSARIIYWFQFS